MAFVALRVFARVGGARTLPGFNAVVVNSRVPTAFAMSAIRTFASKPSIQEAKEMPREYYEMPNKSERVWFFGFCFGGCLIDCFFLLLAVGGVCFCLFSVVRFA
eukprot:c1967_g1_i1.p1 GENE.c1967_g1_i1~~c1967_g1_i1.p1  ORF type:complete len:104 (-),score=17.29 c1967_g1_i1:103-414(-)